MYPYETLFVLQSDLPEAQIRETIDRAKRLIEGAGGSVSGVQEWGVRDLAYQIMKQRRGYYVLIEYTAGAATVWEFERTMKIADEVLRFISVRREPKEARVTAEAESEPSSTGDQVAVAESASDSFSEE